MKKQSCLHAENCHSLVPGMSQYGESQEFSEVGIVVENNAELPQPMDWDQESTTTVVMEIFRLLVGRLEFSTFFSSSAGFFFKRYALFHPSGGQSRSFRESSSSECAKKKKPIDNLK